MRGHSVVQHGAGRPKLADHWQYEAEEITRHGNGSHPCSMAVHGDLLPDGAIALSDRNARLKGHWSYGQRACACSTEHRSELPRRLAADGCRYRALVAVRKPRPPGLTLALRDLFLVCP